MGVRPVVCHEHSLLYFWIPNATSDFSLKRDVHRAPVQGGIFDIGDRDGFAALLISRVSSDRAALYTRNTNC